MVNSIEKGKRGERELADFIREQGFTARRGQQFSGGGDSPDVVHNIPGIHIECKRTETLQMWPALAQAQADCKPGDMPVVFHRPSRRPWIVVLGASDFLTIMTQLSVEKP